MPNADLNIAISAFDLAGWVLSHGGKLVKDDEAVMQCPHCGKFKLAVNLDKRLWHCWVCQSTGDGRGGLLALLELVDGLSRSRAYEAVLQSIKQRPLPERLPQLNGRKPKPSLKWALPQSWPSMTYAITPALYSQFPYLPQRRLSLQTCMHYGLAVGTAGRWVNRLMLPTFERGHLVYWQGRAMFDVKPGEQKALNPTREAVGGTTSSDVVFNLDRAASHHRVALCEGPMDAMRVGDSAVATFGKRISQMQVLKLRHMGVKAVDLMWDGPGPTEPQGAMPEMRRAAPLLASFFHVRIVHLPRGDPDDHTPEDLERWRAQAEPWAG